MKKAQLTEQVSRFDLSIQPQRVPPQEAQAKDAAATKARVAVVTCA